MFEGKNVLLTAIIDGILLSLNFNSSLIKFKFFNTLMHTQYPNFYYFIDNLNIKNIIGFNKKLQ